MQFIATNKRWTSINADFHSTWQNNQTYTVVTEQCLDPVESAWGEAEGQDGPSQQKDREIYLSIAWNAEDNWYTITDSFQLRDETDTAAHIT